MNPTAPLGLRLWLEFGLLPKRLAIIRYVGLHHEVRVTYVPTLPSTTYPTNLSAFEYTTMANSKPIGLRWRSSTLFIVSTVGIGLFTDLFLYGLVVPILPFILRDRVQLQPDQIQSHVSALLAAYAGASVLFSLPAGIIADRLPTRQLPFLTGLTALLLATLLLFLGQNVAVLVVARVLQGISAAVVWTVGLALVLDTVGPDNLGKTIGSVRSHLNKL